MYSPAIVAVGALVIGLVMYGGIFLLIRTARQRAVEGKDIRE